MPPSLEESEKEVEIDHLHTNTYKYLSFGEKLVKIGTPDPEIIGVRAIIKKRKKKEINASKCAERDKQIHYKAA